MTAQRKIQKFICFAIMLGAVYFLPHDGKSIAAILVAVAMAFMQGLIEARQ